MPFKPTQGDRLQVNAVANVLWRNDKTISITVKKAHLSHRICDNRKCSEQSKKADHTSLETVFLIAICRQLDDKLQSKTTLFLKIFDLRSSMGYTVTKF